MFCRESASAVAVIFAVIASQSVLGQTTIFEDTFESYGVQNPAPDPLGPWSYIGPGGANSSRTFQPGAGAAGANSNSIGWISNVDGSFLNTTISLGALAGTGWEDGGGNLLASNVYTLSFMHAAETASTTRSSQFSYDISSLVGTLAFDSGGNGDGSQTLSGLADGGTNFGGPVGKSPERLWDVNFTGTGLTTGDELDLQIGRVTGDAFAYFDDIKLIVSDGNIMPPVVNTGSRVVYDNALGSPFDQDWVGSELSATAGVDADADGRIDGMVGDFPSENHGPVIASTGDAAWQYNDDWTQEDGDNGLDNGTFIYPLNPATASNMNDNGFSYALTLENLGSDGGFLSIGALSDGTTGLFGTGATARTRWGIAASEVPVDGQLHDVTWTWDSAAGTMEVAIDGNAASNVITGGTNALFGGSIPGGAVFTWGDNTAGNPNTALNLVHADLTVVPEPSSAVLVLLGLATLILRRRR